jgi:hypothetical protein
VRSIVLISTGTIGLPKGAFAATVRIRRCMSRMRAERTKLHFTHADITCHECDKVPELRVYLTRGTRAIDAKASDFSSPVIGRKEKNDGCIERETGRTDKLSRTRSVASVWSDSLRRDISTSSNNTNPTGFRRWGIHSTRDLTPNDGKT